MAIVFVTLGRDVDLAGGVVTHDYSAVAEERQTVGLTGGSGDDIAQTGWDIDLTS